MGTYDKVSKMLRWMPFTLLGQDKGNEIWVEKALLIAPQVRLAGRSSRHYY